MTSPQKSTRAYAVEDFLQALTAQLDKTQDILALKVRGTGRPLTWALKDLSIDLRVFVEVDGNGKVLLRSAGPNEEGASTLHLNLTTITRPMVEENTASFHEDVDPRSIDDIRAAANLDEADQRRLDWMGIRTVGQLRKLSGETPASTMEAMIGLPIGRLQAALEAASRPAVTGQQVVETRDGETLLRLSGANLSDGLGTEVKLSGDAVEVVESRPHQLLVRPLDHHEQGPVEITVGGKKATGFFRLPKRRNGGTP